MERLESLVANGRKLPLTSSVVVDQSAALDLIDQLRVAIPEEIKNAKRINSESDRLLDQAREEAEQILGRAQEQAAYLIEERELTRQAEEMSREIVGQAQAEAEEIRRGADDYATEVLVALEGEIVRTLNSIKSGLEVLDDRRAAAAARPPADRDDLDEYEEQESQEQPVGG